MSTSGSEFLARTMQKDETRLERIEAKRNRMHSELCTFQPNSYKRASSSRSRSFRYMEHTKSSLSARGVNSTQKPAEPKKKTGIVKDAKPNKSTSATLSQINKALDGLISQQVPGSKTKRPLNATKIFSKIEKLVSQGGPPSEVSFCAETPNLQKQHFR